MNKGLMLRKIKDADKAYYMDDNPIMSDEEYDTLRNTYISLYGSKDLDYVSGDIKKGLKPFKHTCNINSLKKIRYYEKEKLIEEIRRLSPIVVEPKYDGLTVVAYPSGEFVTRGGGLVGEVLNNFPSRYNKNTSEFPIRGEAYLTVKDFEIINADLRNKGMDLYKNPRNACAGILRRIDSSPYKEYVKYICYDVIGSDAGELDKIKYIKEHTNFDVAETFIPPACDLADYFSKLYDKKSKEDIPIDGLVIKTTFAGSLKRFGSTDHHPRNAFAYKSQDEIKATNIISVEWQVGRESVTPIAIFEPVELEGTTVSKASLSNAGLFMDLDLHIGDTVSVFKANQIIPQIKSKLANNGGNKIELPKTCPVCGCALESRKNNDTYTIVCPNEMCKGKLVNKIEYMFSKKCLNAKGMSSKTIEKMLPYINHPTDIFNITLEQILTLEGFKEKSANNLYNAIQNSRKNVSLDVFIASIGFLGIGFDVGKLLANKYNTYDKVLMGLQNDSLTDIKGIGETTALKLKSNNFIHEMKKLHEYIEIKEETFTTNNNCLTFVITGKFSQPRSVLEKMIEQAGHKVASAISKNTNYLVISDLSSTSSKTKKAKQLGIPMIDDKQLENILQEG